VNFIKLKRKNKIPALGRDFGPRPQCGGGGGHTCWPSDYAVWRSRRRPAERQGVEAPVGVLEQKKGNASGTVVEADTHHVGGATVGREGGKESGWQCFSTARVLPQTLMTPGVALQLREGNATVRPA
jgi:hypothetical protein